MEIIEEQLAMVNLILRKVITKTKRKAKGDKPKSRKKAKCVDGEKDGASSLESKGPQEIVQA